MQMWKGIRKLRALLGCEKVVSYEGMHIDEGYKICNGGGAGVFLGL